ncbi:hypothetical protein SK128_026716 [Halocaridina rubra]|uniref:Uncharacterized protein n=1 Tax=Halocaridina rubra TaxID=373956 RepID=A0AAN8WJW0_HALRR
MSIIQTLLYLRTADMQMMLVCMREKEMECYLCYRLTTGIICMIHSVNEKFLVLASDIHPGVDGPLGE